MNKGEIAVIIYGCGWVRVNKGEIVVIIYGCDLEEHTIQEIIDSRHRGRGWQFLVHGSGYGPHHDKWLPAAELNDCEALDLWYQTGGDGPDSR